MALFSIFWMEDIDFHFALGHTDYGAKLGTHKSSKLFPSPFIITAYHHSEMCFITIYHSSITIH